MKQRLPVDWVLVCLWLTLMSIGLVMVSSASISFAAETYQNPWYFVMRHSIYLLLAITGAIVVYNIPMSLWEKYGSVLFVVALVLLVVVLIPGIGKKVNGSQRWLALGSFTVQASEVAKFAAVVFFAGYFSRRQEELAEGWRGFIKPVLVMCLIAVLLLLEPDFGSTVVICGTIIAMIFLAGVRLSQFLLLLVSGVSLLALVAVLSPYRMQRLITYLDPWADQFNSGYQLTQSLIAFGRGEWFGVGLGNSIQKLFFLPEAHTDFIFAIVAEESGLFGVCVVLGLFIALVSRMLKTVDRLSSHSAFSAFAVFGFAIIFASQTFINVGVASGLLPTKGLTLPLISYGGSSLIVCFAMLAFTLRAGSEAMAAKSKQQINRPRQAKALSTGEVLA